MSVLSADRIETVVPVVAWRDVLRPPDGLLARVRWLFTIAALGLAVVLGLGSAAFAAHNGRLPITPAVVMLVLAVVWLHGYRQGGASIAVDVLCAVGIAVLGAALPDVRFAQFALFLSVWNRSMHTTGRKLALTTAILVIGFFGAALLSPAGSVLSVYVLGAAAVAIAFAVILSMVATVLAVYERTVARERRLRAAAHALAEAKDRPAIYAATVSGARELLAGTAECGIELAVGGERDMTVVGGAGQGADTSAPLHVTDLPAEVHGKLHAGSPFEVRHAETALWRALDFAPRSGEGTVYGVPLVAHGTFEGAVIVGSHDPLDGELKDDVQTLADLAALAIESQSLLEARAAGKKVLAGDTAVVMPAAPFERAKSSVRVQAAAERPVWRMPHALPQRVRWTFLVAGLIATLWVAVRSIAGIEAGGPSALQIVAILSPLWLGAWWVYGYRRGGFPIVGDVVVAVLLTLTVASTPELLVVQPALVTAVWLRAGYGSRSSVAIATVLAIVAFLVAPLVTPKTGAGALEVQGQLLMPVALVLLATLFHFVAETLGRYERALGRERGLRVAGALLVAATDRAHVYAATLDGARELLRGTRGASAVVGVGSPKRGEATIDSDDLDVVAATGTHAAHADGKAIHLKDVSESLRATLHAGDVADQPRADEATWRALDLEGQVGALYAAPLHVRGALEGAIVVGSDAPLDGELKDDLQTLASLAALAIEDIVLLETA